MGNENQEAAMSAYQGFWHQRMVAVGVLVLVLVGLFSPFLARLFQLATESDLYSHLPLIPVVSIYLLFIARGRASGDWRPSRGLAGLLGGLGAAALVFYLVSVPKMEGMPANDLLVWPMVSLVCLIYAVVAVCCGWPLMRAYWFELLFLVFFIPMSSPLVHGCGVFLQHATADVLNVMLKLTGTTFFREGQVFQLPGLTLEVALECSGIRSTLVLVITGLLAGHLFFRRRWKKIVLILAMVPLGIVRNAFRIACLGLLTIHVDDRIIDGPIHHQGGPLFFVLSLGVLFVLVLILRRIGREKTTEAPT